MLQYVQYLTILNRIQYNNIENVVTLLTITHELYTKMFRDQKFQVSSFVSN